MVTSGRYAPGERLTEHALLMSHWERLIPLVQIYMSLHHKQHGSHGQFSHMTRRYLEIARGECLSDILDHIEDHMRQGLDAVIETMTET